MANALVQHHKTHLHQVDILGTFYDIISLSKALPAFRNLKSVTISSFDASEIAPLSLQSATTRAFWAVIKALNNCPFPLESFTIDSLYYSTLVEIPPPKLDQIHEALENLKQFSILKLSMGAGMGDLQSRTVLEDIISQTPSLEVLRIGNEDRWRAIPHRNSQFLLHLENSTLFHWPHLRVLEMKSGASIVEARLVMFIGRHGPTLRELKLEGFSLRAGHNQISDWRVVFESLRAMLTLDKLVLSDLRTENRRDRGAGDDFFSKVGRAQLSEWEKWVPRARGK